LPAGLRSDVTVTEVAPGLRRWTAWHEEWGEEVGCVAVETDDGLVLVDPLDPPRQLGRPRHVLLTVYWHARSAKGPNVWAHRRASAPLARRGVALTCPFVPGDPLPGGIRAFATARTGEVVYWLPQQRALVAGDVLLGAGAKPRPTQEPLRLSPEHWLGRATRDDLRRSLQPLLELPVARVLVSHGAPVLRGGARALAACLAQP
jgi:glyoxylase-like metal-dependent hydrolase (beta-lactamase superfamily II)